MAEMNNTVKVNVYGKEYTIAGQASRGDILRYAKYVDEKIESLLGGKQKSLNADIMVLIAMNIAEDLYKVVSDRDEALEIIVEKDQALEGQNELWDKTNSAIQDYEEAKDEINRLEKEYAAVKTEAANLKEENRQLYKKMYELREELDKIKNSTLQMQMFLPDEESPADNENLKEENDDKADDASPEKNMQEEEA